MDERMTDERLAEFEAKLERFGARFLGQEQRELLKAFKAERAKVDELERLCKLRNEALKDNVLAFIEKDRRIAELTALLDKQEQSDE